MNYGIDALQGACDGRGVPHIARNEFDVPGKVIRTTPLRAMDLRGKDIQRANGVTVGE
jgi:hypothetical protein